MNEYDSEMVKTDMAFVSTSTFTVFSGLLCVVSLSDIPNDEVFCPLIVHLIGKIIKTMNPEVDEGAC